MPTPVECRAACYRTYASSFKLPVSILVSPFSLFPVLSLFTPQALLLPLPTSDSPLSSNLPLSPFPFSIFRLPSPDSRLPSSVFCLMPLIFLRCLLSHAHLCQLCARTPTCTRRWYQMRKEETWNRCCLLTCLFHSFLYCSVYKSFCAPTACVCLQGLCYSYRVSVYKSLCCTCTYDGPSIKGCCAAPGRPVLHLYVSVYKSFVLHQMDVSTYKSPAHAVLYL